MAALEVVVIGAGVIGMTTAHALLDEGHRVTLLDAETGAARGASHANGGFLSAGFCAPWAAPGLPRHILSAFLSRHGPIAWRPDFRGGQLRWLRELFRQCTASRFIDHRARMVRLALLSRSCLRDIVDHTGITFDAQSSGVLQIMRHRPAEPVLTRRLQDFKALGIDARWCEAEQLRCLEPGLSEKLPLSGGFHVKDDASGDCEQFVQKLLAWNLQRGLQFEPGVRIDALDLDRSGRRLLGIRSGTRRWDASAFVFATGADSPKLLRSMLKLPVVPVKGYSVTLPAEPDSRVVGAVIDDTSKLAVARMGSRIRLAGMAELVGHDRRIDPGRCEQLIAHFEALYGPVDRSRTRLWAGLRPTTPDGTPVIGATGVQGLYLNTGHGTYGWTLACGSARLLADVIAGRPAALDPDDYAIGRFGPGRARGVVSSHLNT